MLILSIFQGGFVLYRLFDKSDERNSSPSEIEGSGQSALPASSSPGNTLNETEEFSTPPDQEIPSNLLDDQQHLAYRSGCSASLKQGESVCTSNAASKLVDHETNVAGESVKFTDAYLSSQRMQYIHILLLHV